MGTPPTIDNIIHSQGSFSHILYKSYMQSCDLLHLSYVWVGQFRLCSKLINGGVAIRMSWYAFFEEKIVGGDVYSGLESRHSVNAGLQGALHLLYNIIIENKTNILYTIIKSI